MIVTTEIEDLTAAEMIDTLGKSMQRAKNIKLISNVFHFLLGQHLIKFV